MLDNKELNRLKEICKNTLGFLCRNYFVGSIVRVVC